MALSELIERGGLYRNIGGTTIEAVLTSFIKALPPSPHVMGEDLLRAVLEREALMPTGIGNGIALPHPRNPFAMDNNGQFVTLAYLENPINWTALDGNMVDTLLLIVSSSANLHLRILSEITFFSRQENFIRLIKERSSLDELLDFIRHTEKTWD